MNAASRRLAVLLAAVLLTGCATARPAVKPDASAEAGAGNEAWHPRANSATIKTAG